MTMAIFESFLRMLDGGNAVDEETKILLFIDQCPSVHPSDTSYLTHFTQLKQRVACQRMGVKQPHLIQAYNSGMGGVDLLDSLVAVYRPTIRGKKWYWPLFANAICLGHTLQGRAVTFVTFRIPTAGDNVCCKQKCLTMKFGSVEPQLGRCLISLIYGWTGSSTHFVNVHKGDVKCAGRIPRIYVANVMFSCMPKEEKSVSKCIIVHNKAYSLCFIKQ
ncbi:putative piggyBac transposable element-derived protein 3 [Trichinella spiralis]|uniref:PiggyBac transposable element-derived protein 3 n=1 Tax=Trichinella spiralis TaxID=6334 RepID=E5S8U0_TRISP|nr:putative piggyBac transposable element-derived protein 3 [Trichinella spiralis]KRY41980.1 PiggyBac transposable element-derived protein 3 [Trichinella spiralis]